MYKATTFDIEITATPKFIEEQSVPSDDHFVWSYTIKIENKGKHHVHLLHRYWQVVDERGQVKNVEGPGVIGMQPIIEPNKDFEYTSGTDLNTPSGVMHGKFKMARQDGKVLIVDIPAFSLDCPHGMRKAN